MKALLSQLVFSVNMPKGTTGVSGGGRIDVR